MTTLNLLRRGGIAARTCLALLALLFCALPVLAQSDSARLTGTVTDPSGAAVSGATITVTSLETGRVVTAQSEENGGYTVSALLRGQYRVEVKRDGFKAVKQDITLEIQQVATLDFTLETGAVTDVIEVNDDVPLVTQDSSSIGSVVQGRQVTELPLNGRNFTQLAVLIPGVTRGAPDGAASGAGGNVETFRNGDVGGGALAVNGLRPQANNFTLDGVDNNESLVNSILTFTPVEAIREFRVQTSIAPAEYGRAGGALVNVSVKSGSNQFHGSAFEFLRNSELDARDTFNNGRKPLFQRNQFGGTIGGPVKKDKIFFFFSYEGLRQQLPLGVDIATVPTALMRQGNFSELLNPALTGGQTFTITDPITNTPFAGNIIPAARINQVGQRYLNAFPLANNGTQIFGNYRAIRVDTQDFNNYDARGDFNISSKDTVFVRGSYGTNIFDRSSRLPALPSGFASGSNEARVRAIAGGWTHIFTPNLINEVRGAANRIRYGYLPPFNDRQISADLGIPNANTSPLLGGGALIGGFNGQLEYTGDFGPFLVPQNTFQILDTLQYTTGSHTIRGGVNILRRQVNLFRPSRGKGFFFLVGNGNADGTRITGYEVSDVLAGFVQNYQIGTPFGMVGTRNWETGFFVQDDWRVNRRLTLNLGLRYDLYTFPTEVANRQANFNLRTGQLDIAGQNGNSRSLIPTDKNNLAPRLGFAIDVFGNGKTIVRGGYGLFFFLDRGGIDNQLAQNPPFSGFQTFTYQNGFRISLSGQAPLNSTDSRLSTGALPLGTFPANIATNPTNVSVFAALPTNTNSYTQQYNVSVQQQLTSNMALQVAYVGTKGNNLTFYYDANRAQFGRPQLFPALGGNINVQDTRGSSDYHSLQVQLTRRLSNGWQFLASYTWSHTIDDGLGAFDTGQPIDLRQFRLERSSSGQDLRHRFVYSSLYELPFGRGKRYGSNWNSVTNFILGGWQINPILTLQAGFPFNVTANNNRPDVVAAGTAGSRVINGVSLLNVANDSRPGTLGRNVFTGPTYKNLDFSLFKNFAIYEQLKGQFRWEVFNVTNTPQFSNPNSNFFDGNFGRIQGTRFRSNRIMQFALRLNF